MLDQRRSWWANINSTVGQYLVCVHSDQRQNMGLGLLNSINISTQQTRKMTHAGLILGQRRRRCSNIEPTLGRQYSLPGHNIN